MLAGAAVFLRWKWKLKDIEVGTWLRGARQYLFSTEVPGASWEQRIWDPAEDGNSQEETCPAGNGDTGSDPDSPTRRSQQSGATSGLTVCLMLEPVPPLIPAYCPSLGFPQSRPETRVQEQVAYWEMQVTPVEEGDVI